MPRWGSKVMDIFCISCWWTSPGKALSTLKAQNPNACPISCKMPPASASRSTAPLVASLCFQKSATDAATTFGSAIGGSPPKGEPSPPSL